MYTTSRQVSKKLHELGIEEESEFVFIDELGTRPERREEWVLDSFDVWFPTYTIDELVPVLQKLGKKKDWDNIWTQGYDCYDIPVVPHENCPYCGNSVIPSKKSKYQFSKICSLIADGHPEKVDEYLINLIEE